MKHFRQSEGVEDLGKPMSFEEFNDLVDYMELIEILRTMPVYHASKDANIYLKWFAENAHKIEDIITPF